MGRGRSRGRGMSNVTASPVASQGASAAACFQTYYDGVDDYFTTTDASLKAAGQYTIAGEVDFDSISANDTIWGARVPAGGMNVYMSSNGAMNFIVTDSGANSIPVTSVGAFTTGAGFQTFVCVVNATTASIYVDGSLDGTGAASLTSGSGATSTTPHLCTAHDATSRVFHGSLRNFTIRSGATSTPTAWTPTDPTSLVGTTGILYSTKGNDENDDGISFTKFGDPVTSACP